MLQFVTIHGCYCTCFEEAGLSISMTEVSRLYIPHDETSSTRFPFHSVLFRNLPTLEILCMFLETITMCGLPILAGFTNVKFCSKLNILTLPCCSFSESKLQSKYILYFISTSLPNKTTGTPNVLHKTTVQM